MSITTCPVLHEVGSSNTELITANSHVLLYTRCNGIHASFTPVSQGFVPVPGKTELHNVLSSPWVRRGTNEIRGNVEECAINQNNGQSSSKVIELMTNVHESFY